MRIGGAPAPTGITSIIPYQNPFVKRFLKKNKKKILHPSERARGEDRSALRGVNCDLVGEGREACFTPSEGSRQRFGEGGEIFPISLEGGFTAPSNYVLNNHRSIPPCFTVP